MGRGIVLGWQAAFWLAAFVILCGLLWLFSAVLPPFVVALVIGYLLDPLVNRLERVGLGRAGAASVILVVSLVVIALTIALFSPMLARQVSGFIKTFPDLVRKAQELGASAGEQVAHGWIGNLMQKYGLGGRLSDLSSSANDIINKVVNWFVSFGNSLLSRGAALLDLLSLVVITPVVAFYMLVDWPKMIASIDGLVPPRDRNTVRAIARDIDRALAGFLRGQGLVCLFLAAWYGIGLSLIQLNFGLLIGITGGLLAFIPYVGSLMVLVLSLLIAVVQGWPSWHLPVEALGIVLIGQFLEGNVLSPKLVGDKVGLHPVWIIFALLGFGSVFGFTGLLVAVPVASAIGVLLRFGADRYKKSPIYTGAMLVQPQVRVLAPTEPSSQDAGSLAPLPPPLESRTA